MLRGWHPLHNKGIGMVLACHPLLALRTLCLAVPVAALWHPLHAHSCLAVQSQLVAALPFSFNCSPLAPTARATLRYPLAPSSFLQSQLGPYSPVAARRRPSRLLCPHGPTPRTLRQLHSARPDCASLVSLPTAVSLGARRGPPCAHRGPAAVSLGPTACASFVRLPWPPSPWLSLPSLARLCGPSCSPIGTGIWKFRSSPHDAMVEGSGQRVLLSTRPFILSPSFPVPDGALSARQLQCPTRRLHPTPHSYPSSLHDASSPHDASLPTHPHHLTSHSHTTPRSQGA